MTTLRRWETTIWIGRKNQEAITLYAESLEELRNNVSLWLYENKPERFSNAPSNYSARRKIRHYFCSDGAYTIQIDPRGNERTLPIGWYYITQLEAFPQPHELGQFRYMVEHFVTEALITQPGPDYTQLEQGYRWLNWLMPLVYGACIGLLSSVCYLATPTAGGANQFVQAGSWAVILVIVIFVVGFTIIGEAIYVTRRLYRRWKNQKKQPPTT